MSLSPSMSQVGALSCTFIRGHARERDECMISLCTFGKLVFAGRNNGRKAAKMFKSFLDHTCLKAIMSRFNHFNEHGGAFVRMNDHLVHFFSTETMTMSKRWASLNALVFLEMP